MHKEDTDAYTRMVKSEIERGIKDSKHGKVTPHEQVRHRYESGRPPSNKTDAGDCFCHRDGKQITLDEPAISREDKQ